MNTRGLVPLKPRALGEEAMMKYTASEWLMKKGTLDARAGNTDETGSMGNTDETGSTGNTDETGGTGMKDLTRAEEVGTAGIAEENGTGNKGSSKPSGTGDSKVTGELKV